MYKTAFLHVGYDKTGSTALQATSASLQEQLKVLGVHYPRPIVGRNHLFIASAFHDRPALADFNRAIGRSTMPEAEIRREDNDQLSNYRTQIESGGGSLLLSFEGFIWLSERGHKRLYDWLRGFTNSVKVLMYVRDPHSYALSAISQQVRTGRPVKLSVHRHHKNIPKLLNVYGRENVIVREFARDAMAGGDVCHDCYSLIGLPDEQIRRLLSQIRDPDLLLNRSLSMHAIGVGEALRSQLAGTRFQGVFGAQWRFGQVFGSVLDSIPGPVMSLSAMQELFLFANPRVRSSSRYLFDEFGIDFRRTVRKHFSQSLRTHGPYRSQFKALRQRGIYDKLAASLIDQMASDIEKGEATNFPGFGGRSTATNKVA